jgi:hypothetical protein
MTEIITPAVLIRAKPGRQRRHHLGKYDGLKLCETETARRRWLLSRLGPQDYIVD